MDGCEPPRGCWELNLGLLEESMLLTAETPLQLLDSETDPTHYKIIRRSYVIPVNLTQRMTTEK